MLGRKCNLCLAVRRTSVTPLPRYGARDDSELTQKTNNVRHALEPTPPVYVGSTLGIPGFAQV